MAVGPLLPKLPYLAGPVTITGTVSESNDKENLAFGDGLNLSVDTNYLNLVWAVAGSGGNVHCETYPLGADQTNFVGPWTLPMKPADVQFTINDGSAATQPLQLRNHIAVTGFLRIETGHPTNESMRGLLKVGQVFLELHPFDYTNSVWSRPPSRARQRPGPSSPSRPCTRWSTTAYGEPTRQPA